MRWYSLLRVCHCLLVVGVQPKYTVFNMQVVSIKFTRFSDMHMFLHTVANDEYISLFSYMNLINCDLTFEVMSVHTFFGHQVWKRRKAG